MNWKQLPKEKKNNLILVGLLTAIALGLVGFGLIRFQYDHLNQVLADTADAKKRLRTMNDSIRASDQIETEATELAKTLSVEEEGMAGGDKYTWVYETVRRFKVGHKGLSEPTFSQPSAEVDANLLPKFPYKQFTITIAGTGFYHDIGKFVADFENQFPHIRVCNLTLDPVSGLVGGEKEKLDFKMDIVVLVRPNPS